MRTDYSEISYDGLQKMQAALKEAIDGGAPEVDLREQLSFIEREMGTRCFALTLYYDGHRKKEWGRWQSRDMCEAIAKRDFLPVGDYEVGGKPLAIRVEQVD